MVFFSASLRKYPLIRFLANALGSIWLFFPSILFLALGLICFTQLGQGKDLLISFTETSGSFGGILLSKFIFLVAITFWVYVSWYSSRMIAYIKGFQHRLLCNQVNPTLGNAEYEKLFDMELRFLHRFPRIIGYACLLTILISLSLLLTKGDWVREQPFLFLIGGMLALWIIDRQMIRLSSYGQGGRLLKIMLITSAVVIPFLLVLYTVTGLFSKAGFIILLVLLLLVVYMLYINLRRHRMEELERMAARVTEVSARGWRRWINRLMDWLHLPREERGYFTVFNIVCGVGLTAYTAAIFMFPASTRFGPFAVILLAFAVLLGFGNVITALSCKFRINVHFFIFILAAFLPTPDHHRVRTGSLSERRVPMTVYQDRQHLSEYMKHWLYERPEIDSMQQYPVYFVLANGGASRSAYWVSTVLGRLEDASIDAKGPRFSRQLFCLSGTSGGGVGISTYYSQLLHQQEKSVVAGFENSGRSFLRQDFLSFTLARMLGPDFFNYIPLLNKVIPDEDRAEALEQAIERSTDKAYYRVGFDSTWFDQCLTQKGIPHRLPILLINTTRVKDGSPGVVSNIQLSTNIFNRRVDVAGLLQADKTIRLSTAAILGARFPYMSPAGRIDQYRQPSSPGGTDTVRAHYFVDGGYFDNSGAGAVQEMIRALLLIGADTEDPVIKRRFEKLSLKVLHITNSPQGTVPLQPIGPFVNDLMAPLLTIVGAYDMQTTVNDRRFITYINDLKAQARAKGLKDAEYIPIHLYNDPAVAGDTMSRGPYAMNWYISDSVRRQMDRRLLTQPRLQQLITDFR